MRLKRYIVAPNTVAELCEACTLATIEPRDVEALRAQGEYVSESDGLTVLSHSQYTAIRPHRKGGK